MPDFQPISEVMRLLFFFFIFFYFFVLKAASFPNAGCFCVSDACNPGACNQQSTSILG
jgi:hypothetical protein